MTNKTPKITKTTKTPAKAAKAGTKLTARKIAQVLTQGASGASLPIAPNRAEAEKAFAEMTEASRMSPSAGLKVVVFDESGPHDLGEQSPSGVHNVIAEALGEPMLAPHAEAEVDRVEAELVAKHEAAPVAPIDDVVGALLSAPAGSVVDIVSGEVHAKPPAVQIARKPAKAPKAAKAPKSDALTDELRRLLVALLNAEAFGNLPVDERVGVWVRSAAVHKSSRPHGLFMNRIPGLMGGLKKRGLIECGWDKAATVRLTPAGLAAGKAR